MEGTGKQLVVGWPPFSDTNLSASGNKVCESSRRVDKLISGVTTSDFSIPMRCDLALRSDIGELPESGLG